MAIFMFTQYTEKDTWGGHITRSVHYEIAKMFLKLFANGELAEAPVWALEMVDRSSRPDWEWDSHYDDSDWDHETREDEVTLVSFTSKIRIAADRQVEHLADPAKEYRQWSELCKRGPGKQCHRPKKGHRAGIR